MQGQTDPSDSHDANLWDVEFGMLSFRCSAVKTIVTIGYDSTNPRDRELWIKQEQIDGI